MAIPPVLAAGSDVVVAIASLVHVVLILCRNERVKTRDIDTDFAGEDVAVWADLNPVPMPYFGLLCGTGVRGQDPFAGQLPTH